MFDKPLQVEALDDGTNWKVLRRFVWKEDKLKVEVHKNFVTDFGSVPLMFVPLTGDTDDGAQSFALHDYCYKFRPYGLGRLDYDSLLDRALAWQNRPWNQRLAIRVGLLVGGWYTWLKYRKKDKQQIDP